MTAITGIPTTRVSNLFVRQRLLNQVQSDYRELFRVQTQLNTGRRFEVPSDDPVAAAQIVDLQRLLERKEQVSANLTTSQSYLSATDVALSEVSALLADVRGLALSVMDTISTDQQRDAAVQQISQAIQQLTDTGNQQFRGRYLFAGSKTNVMPFQATENGLVEYLGNEASVSSYANIDLLFSTNIDGNEVFGAISETAKGSIDLDPVLTHNTRLADLRGGLGISAGSIAVSDGTNTSIIDISNAETIGDVAILIHENPPDTHSIEVTIGPRGLVLELDSGTLVVQEVASGSTASELGIATTGAGPGPFEGQDLDPIIRSTTRLDNVLGVRAAAIVRSSGADNDLIFEADSSGPALNGIEIVFRDDAVVGAESVDWDGSTLTVHVQNGSTTAEDVVAAVNAAGAPFTCRVDPIEKAHDGAGLISIVDGAVAAVTSGGEGTDFDKDSGLQITNGGTTHIIDFSGAETIEDLLNLLNGADAGVLAQINDNATGINVRSRLSGTDFMIGENGGITATQLGLRTFTGDTRLEDLNFGQGVEMRDGVDFVIKLSDDSTLEIDLTDETTIGEVLTTINAVSLAAGGNLSASLSRVGNGIELLDTAGGPGTLSITEPESSTTATSLGLLPSFDGSIVPPGVSIEAGGTYYTGSRRQPARDRWFGLHGPAERLKNAIALTNNDLTGGTSAR